MAWSNSTKFYQMKIANVLCILIFFVFYNCKGTLTHCSLRISQPCPQAFQAFLDYRHKNENNKKKKTCSWAKCYICLIISVHTLFQNHHLTIVENKIRLSEADLLTCFRQSVRFCSIHRTFISACLTLDLRIQCLVLKVR